MKTTNAQKSEKLRIKLTFVLLVNERTRTPNKGKSIRKDSIKKFEMFIKGSNLWNKHKEGINKNNKDLKWYIFK